MEALRIWREVGWISSDWEEAPFEDFISAARAYVGELRGRPECLVATHPGTVNYHGRELDLCAVTAVTTGRIARRQGIATRLTAQAIARAAESGAHVAGLGVFDQGFYNRVGFGTGSPVRILTFDPASIKKGPRPRLPYQLTVEDAAAVHKSRWASRLTHGNCRLTPVEITRAEMRWTESGFGLGYFDDSGDLTHHIWVYPKGEHGPHSIWWLSYQTGEQFKELMQLVRTLGDQVHAVSIDEPAGIALDDLIEQPFKQLRLTRQSKFEAKSLSYAYWQVRILDLETCISAVTTTEEVRFNLVLDDPVTELVGSESGWQGLSGEYTVSLGARSTVARGSVTGLPSLKAGIGAFSRLWFGVRSAASLSVTDTLNGDPELMDRLDALLPARVPHFAWPY